MYLWIVSVKIAWWLSHSGLKLSTFALKSFLSSIVLCVSVKSDMAWGLQMSLSRRIKIPIWVPGKMQSMKISSVKLEVLICQTMKSWTKRGIWILDSIFCAVSAPGGLLPRCCSIRQLLNFTIQMDKVSKKVIAIAILKNEGIKILNELLSTLQGIYVRLRKWSLTCCPELQKCVYKNLSNGHPENKLPVWWFTIKTSIKVHDQRLNQPVIAIISQVA